MSTVPELLAIDFQAQFRFPMPAAWASRRISVADTDLERRQAIAWAAEMIDLEFPAEAPASSAVQLHDVTLVFGSSDLEDPMKPSFTLVGSLGEERFEYDQLASYEHDPDDSEAELLKREHTLFQARGDSVKCLHLVYDDGTEDYSLILDGKTTSEGDTWQCMLIFKGPPATNTRAWVQGVLDTVR